MALAIKKDLNTNLPKLLLILSAHHYRLTFLRFAEEKLQQSRENVFYLLRVYDIYRIFIQAVRVVKLVNLIFIAPLHNTFNILKCVPFVWLAVEIMSGLCQCKLEQISIWQWKRLHLLPFGAGSIHLLIQASFL